MEFLIKENIYFQIQIPDGTNRQLVSAEFRKEIVPMFRSIVKSIVIDPEDLTSIRKIAGNSADIRILTETEALKRMQTSLKSSSPDRGGTVSSHEATPFVL